MTTAPIDVARAYLDRGWQPIPLPHGTKIPTVKAWQKLRLTHATVPVSFNGAPQNIGVLLGQPSGGLIDVDLDGPEALALADVFLPRTAAVFGRASAPRAHRLYRVAAPLKTEKFADPLRSGHGAMLVELRSSGCQTMMPGSLHPAGEAVAWDEDGVPTEVDGADLRRRTGTLAAAALLARYWPAPGTRHACSLALAGWLLRAKLPPDLVCMIIEHAARLAGDEEAESRGRVVATTAAKLDAGEDVTGFPTAAEIIDPRVLRAAGKWLGVSSFVEATKVTMSAEAGQAPADGQLREVGRLRATTVRLNAVAPEPVTWLWHGRIPLGKVTVLDGDPGLGKSALTLDLAARVSAGRPMPDDTPPDLAGPAGVVLLGAEDGLADTVRPRLEAARADPSRIIALTAVRDATGERPPSLEDIDAVEDAIAEVGARLVVVDPLMAYLPASTNAHRDQDVRRVLAPLAALAERTGAAFLVVRHLNKAAGGDPLYRGGGSIGFIGAARSGLLVARDPDDEGGMRRVLASTKGNLAPPAASLAFHLEADPGGAVRVVWEGVAPYTAQRLLDRPADPADRSALAEAKRFLADLLADGDLASTQVVNQARAAGLSEKTVRRAKDELGVRAVKRGMAGGWMWSLPKEVNAGEDGQPPDDDRLRGLWPASAAGIGGDRPGPPAEADTDGRIVWEEVRL